MQFSSTAPTHPPGHEVCRQTLGEADDGGLGGAIGEPAGGALDGGGHRAHVDDGAAVRDLGSRLLQQYRVIVRAFSQEFLPRGLEMNHERLCI